MVEITSNTKTLELTGGETELHFAAGYGYFWARNDGGGTVLMSLSPNIEEGKDGVIAIPAGGSAGTMHGFAASRNKLYLLGTGKVQIMGTYSAHNPFKQARKGGDITCTQHITDGLLMQYCLGEYIGKVYIEPMITCPLPITVEICGHYNNIPDSSGNGRWLQIYESNAYDGGLVIGQYGNRIDMRHGNGWVNKYPEQATVDIGERVTISVLYNQQELKVYKNGSLVIVANGLSLENSITIYVIALLRGIPGTRELDGNLKSVRIYNRALTEDEIVKNAEADKRLYFREE